MVPLNFQNDHRIGSFQILKRFLINFLHRKVSDKFKDIQKIGSDTKTIRGEADLEKVEEKVEENGEKNGVSGREKYAKLADAMRC